MKKISPRKIGRIKERARTQSGFRLPSLMLGGGVGRVSRTDFASALAGWNAICMDRLTAATASTKYRVMVQKSQNERVEAPLDNWAAKLLLSGKPNPFLRRLQVYSLFEKWKILNGNSFLWTPTYGGKFPVQMWILPSNRMEIGANDAYGVTEYRLNAQDGMHYFDAAEVLHSKNMEPSQDYLRSMFVGTPIINKIIDAIHADNELTRYLRDYFESDTVAPLIYVTPDEMNSETWNNYKSQWNTRFPTHQLHGYLTSGSDIKPLNSGGLGGAGQAMPVTAIDDDMLEKIAGCYGMSAGFVKGNFNNRATAETYTHEFHSNIVNKKAQEFAEELTAHFQQWDSSIVVEAELYKPSDREFALTQMEKELSYGIKTINDVRAEQGLEPVEGGDTRFMPSNLVPLELMLNPPPPTTTPKHVEAVQQAETEVVAKSETADPFTDKAFADAYWKSYDDIAETHASLIKRAVNRAMDALEKEVLGNVQTKAVAGATVKDIDDSVELFDVEKWAEVFAEETDPERKELLIAAMTQALADIGTNWDDVASDFDDKIKAAQTASSDKIKTAVGTVKTQLQELLQKMKDKPVGEVKDAIKEKFSQYTDSGAERIAATTANFTTNRAQRDAWDAYDVRRLWLSQRDKNVRDAHAGADGQEADADGMFSVGGELMPHPGGGSDPKNNIRCRCYQRPRLKEKSIEQMYQKWLRTGRVR